MESTSTAGSAPNMAQLVPFPSPHPPPPLNMGKWRRAKKPQNCSICGKICRFKFYNVQSCEACKQFFRRVILRQTEYFCFSDGKCDLITRGQGCRGCRLDKCLRLGMDPDLIRAERTERIDQFLVRLEKRRRETLLAARNGQNEDPGEKKIAKIGIVLPSQIANEFDRVKNQVCYFSRLIDAHGRIWHGFYDVPDNYLGKFNKIEDILAGPNNILSLSKCFQLQPKKLSNSAIGKIAEEINKCDNFTSHSRFLKGLGVFVMLIVGILKAMPVFKQLPFDDMLIVARQLSLPIGDFLNAYYSARMGANIVVGPNGVSMLVHLNAKFKEEKRLMSLAEKTFVHPLDGFLRMPILAQEEFALLLAILCSNPAISGLSERAQELLQGEQVRCSRLLFQHQQMRLGGPEGAKRYAECIQLIDGALHCARNHELLMIYLEVFHSSGDRQLRKVIQPKCLREIMK